MPINFAMRGKRDANAYRPYCVTHGMLLCFGDRFDSLCFDLVHIARHDIRWEWITSVIRFKTWSVGCDVLAMS